MVGHGGSSAGSYLADPTSPIPFHCASIVVTSTLRVNSRESTSASIRRWSCIVAWCQATDISSADFPMVKTCSCFADWAQWPLHIVRWVDVIGWQGNMAGITQMPFFYIRMGFFFNDGKSTYIYTDEIDQKSISGFPFTKLLSPTVLIPFLPSSTATIPCYQLNQCSVVRHHKQFCLDYLKFIF